MENPIPKTSVFYPDWLLQIARSNAVNDSWTAGISTTAVAVAEPWFQRSDEELWQLVFAPSLRRSWMVWSSGYCPSCGVGVPMYTWGIDANKQPWKVRCPHCYELFPKNDFAAYYRSGLDIHSSFNSTDADPSLLYNIEHPDPQDPLHTFGVDDGNGYAHDGNRWWFIATYLIYGQWKQLIIGGIRALAAAFCLTGNSAYAHKAVILLDRVADLYPSYDFKSQGVMYEGPARAGYVSTWHDACEETREMALAYDQVRDALPHDAELIAFLSDKARQTNLPNAKSAAGDICANIENQILRDAINNRWKIESNYPRTDIAIITLQTILGWPSNRTEVMQLLDAMLDKATAVDGVTGEKGLAAYAAYTIQAVALLLGMFARLDKQFMPDVLHRHSRISDMFRFHIDTWVYQRYYPQVGDTGEFAAPETHYVALPFSRNQWLDAEGLFSLGPSTYSFLWQLYELTGETAFVQVLYHENNSTTSGLPFDIFGSDLTTFSDRVNDVISTTGSVVKLPSVNKEEWHLALMRSGTSDDERVAWLAYDSGGRHSHANGLNLGLFAKGLDLMPDLGYPPVHQGGWSGPKFDWYLSTPAHNTVTVDGHNHATGSARTTLWANGKKIHAIRSSGVDLIRSEESATLPLQFERTVIMVDISDVDSYILDIFRVCGGCDHARFMHSHYSTLTTQGLRLEAGGAYDFAPLMRHYQTDPNPEPGWSVDWKVDDRQNLLSSPRDIHLRYIDLSDDVEASTAEGWIATGGFMSNAETWLPCLVTRRRLPKNVAPPLSSTFVGIIEPYEKTSNILSTRRIKLSLNDGNELSANHIAVEIVLASGQRDIVVAMDTENPLNRAPFWISGVNYHLDDNELQCDGELCWLRFNSAGKLTHYATWGARSLRTPTLSGAIHPTQLFEESDLT